MYVLGHSIFFLENLCLAVQRARVVGTLPRRRCCVYVCMCVCVHVCVGVCVGVCICVYVLMAAERVLGAVFPCVLCGRGNFCSCAQSAHQEDVEI
jgi:hypothetical protein